VSVVHLRASAVGIEGHRFTMKDPNAAGIPWREPSGGGSTDSNMSQTVTGSKSSLCGSFSGRLFEP